MKSERLCSYVMLESKGCIENCTTEISFEQVGWILNVVSIVLMPLFEVMLKSKSTFSIES
jgi:hypothetical protein